MATTSDDDASDSGELTPAELQMGVVILGAFAAYSVWVVYATSEAWAFAAAVGTSASFLLTGFLYLVGTRAVARETDVTDGVDNDIGDDGGSRVRGPGEEAAGELDVGSGPVKFVGGMEVPDATVDHSTARDNRTRRESDD